MALVNPTIILVGDDKKTLIEASDLAGVITVNGAVGTFSTIVLQGSVGTVVKNTTNNGTALSVVLTPAEIATLGNGAVEVTVSTTDLVNTVIAPDGSDGDFLIDTIPLTTSTEITSISVDSNVSDDFVTNDNTLTVTGGLSGFLTGDDKVEVSSDGGATWNVATFSGLSWSYDDSAKPDGTVTYQARLVDAAGNTTTPVSKEVVIDTLAPTSSLEITAITDDTGLVIDDFITKDNTLTVLGGLSNALPIGEKVQVSSDGGTTWNDATVSGSSWSYVDATVHPDGNLVYKARIIDLAGNETGIFNQTVTIDTVAPTASIEITSITDDTNVTDDYVTRDNTLTISGALSAALGVGEKVQVSSDNGLTWNNAAVIGTNWGYVEAASKADGVYNYQARVIDTAGNIGSTHSKTVTIDTAASTSVLAITAISNDSNIVGDFVTNDTTLTVSGTLSVALNAGEKVQVSVDGLNWADATAAGNHLEFLLTP